MSSPAARSAARASSIVQYGDLGHVSRPLDHADQDEESSHIFSHFLTVLADHMIEYVWHGQELTGKGHPPATARAMIYDNHPGIALQSQVL